MLTETHKEMKILLEKNGSMTLDDFVLKMPMQRRHSLRGRLSELVEAKEFKKIGNYYYVNEKPNLREEKQ